VHGRRRTARHESATSILADVQDAEHEWAEQARRVAEVCAADLPLLAGVYVHGSAALGGFTAASDLDILVIGDGSDDPERLGRRLLATSQPFPLELSVVTAAAAAAPSAPWPYVVHVDGPERVVTDEGAGDPDLIAHFAVARHAGIAVVGPPARSVVGPVPRPVLLSYLGDELRWGVEHADERYAVLNACRAAAYASEGLLLSKVVGARWWLDRHDGDVVRRALAAQLAGRDLGTCSPEARALVVRVAATLARPPDTKAWALDVS